MQSIDSIETYAHGISKDPIPKKENTNCISITKAIEKCSTLIILQKET